MGRAKICHAGCGALVQHRILHLMRCHRNAGCQQRGKLRRVKVGDADKADLAGLAQLVQPLRGGNAAGHGVVPPMKLHKVELRDAKARQRAVYQALNVSSAQSTECLTVRHAFGVHLNSWCSAQPFEAANQLLDTSVNIGAVKGGDAGRCISLHLGVGGCGGHAAVPARQLPAAHQQPRD